MRNICLFLIVITVFCDRSKAQVKLTHNDSIWIKAFVTCDKKDSIAYINRQDSERVIIMEKELPSPYMNVARKLAHQDSIWIEFTHECAIKSGEVEHESEMVVMHKKHPQWSKDACEREVEWQNSEAGKIHNKYPEWTKKDCERVANGKIWIGMSREDNNKLRENAIMKYDVEIRYVEALIKSETSIKSSTRPKSKGKPIEPIKAQEKSVLLALHPLVQKTAGKLYQDGHYRQAILDTYIALVETVKTKSGEPKLDNTPLMQSVFSPKTPKIKISKDPDEQQGFMWLFTGAVMAIRNPKAHRLNEQNDPQRTLEWLSFASVLLRVIDDSGDKK